MAIFGTQIIDLPNAAPLTGNEVVPVVQNGITAKTTISAIAADSLVTPQFLVLAASPDLMNERVFGVTGSGLTATDGGAGNSYLISLAGTVKSLQDNLTTGILVKDTTSTLTARSLTQPAAGFTITNSDGVSGNPAFALSHSLASLQGLSGTGAIFRVGTDTLTLRTNTGTANQITVTNGDGVSGAPTFAIASNPVLPGTGGVTLPQGTTGQRAGTVGTIRWNTSLSQFEGYDGSNWAALGSDGGGAPTNATYVTLTTDTTLTNERTLAVSSNLSLTDGGAGLAVTIGTGVFTGDVTTSANSFATTIANAAVTYAKIQNVGANSVLCRAAATSGAVGEIAIGASQLFGRGSTGDLTPITLGTNLSMSGTTLNATGGGGGAPTGATYITVSLDGTLTAERTLAVGAALTLTDGGANSTITVGTSAFTGDVTTSANSFDTAIGANKVLDTMIRQSSGLSVIGRSANTTGNVADITGTANQVLRVSGTTLGFGSIDLSQSATVGSSVLAQGNGGTGFSTYTLGDIIYSSATNTLSKLAGNTTTAKQYLSQTGNGTISAAPSWATISGSDITGAALTRTDDTNVTLTLGGTPTTALLRAASLTLGWTGQLAVARGGTGFGTATQGDIIYSDASNSFAKLAKDTNATRYLSNTGTSNNPAWAQIDLSNGVTGDLPFSNLTQGSARSVLGVTGNSTADVASIQGTADQVLVVNGAGTALAFGTVATGGITNNAVTFAKMQQITTDRLLGRDTAATGNVEEISVGGGLEFSGSTAIQRSSLTGDVTASAGSNSTTIANDAVTYAKMQNISATQRILGRNTAGAGDTEEVTISQALDWISTTQGAILYRNATTWVALAPGTSGQVLQTGGAAANPSWLTVSGTGTVTSVALSASGTGLSVSGSPITTAGTITLTVSALQTLWVPSASIRPSSSGGCAALALVATGSNLPDISSLDFDAGTNEFAQFTIRFPKGWDEGTVTAIFHWTANSASANDVIWAIQGLALSDNDAIGTAFGTAQTVTDTNGSSAYTERISAATSAITIAGSPAAGDRCVFRVYRDAAAGGDTLATDAMLLGVSLFYTINTLDDA